MDSTQDLPFRFLAVPQELRDYIYGHILTTTYFVDLAQPRTYVFASEYGQLPPSQHCASSRLAILRVSKSVHYEAIKILFRLSTFLFKIPYTGLPLFQGLGKSSTATLMQNITVELQVLTDYAENIAKPLQPTISILQFFGGPSPPRSTCVVQVLFAFCSDFLLEASFLDALGKLTGFKTVVVKLRAVDVKKTTVRKLDASTYKTMDEYLRVILGAGEAGKLDEAGFYCMTYRPRRLAF